MTVPASRWLLAGEPLNRQREPPGRGAAAVQTIIAPFVCRLNAATGSRLPRTWDAVRVAKEP
jgi:hypothetical protein